MSPQPAKESRPEVADQPRTNSRRSKNGHRYPHEPVRTALRDPLHLPERMAVESQKHHAERARRWAERAQAAKPDASPAVLADDERKVLIPGAAIDGALAGTPFFIALVPAYVEFLRQEAYTYLRIAALYGRDPADPHLAAEYLVLSGVCENEGEAWKAVEHVLDTPVPPRRGKLPVNSWYHAVVSVLTLAGFISPGGTKTRKSGWRARVLRIVQFTVAALVWALTWIVPVTFMIVMAWSCGSGARSFGEKVTAHFERPGDEKAVAAAAAQRKAAHHLLGTIARGALALVSVAIPLALVASTQIHGGLLGVQLPAMLAALLGLTIVIVVATVVYMRTS